MNKTKITSALLGFYGFDIVDNGDDTFSYERKVYLTDDKVFFKAIAPDVHGGWLISISENATGWKLHIRPFKDKDKYDLNELKLRGTLNYDLFFEENERERFETLVSAMTGLKFI